MARSPVRCWPQHHSPANREDASLLPELWAATGPCSSAALCFVSHPVPDGMCNETDNGCTSTVPATRVWRQGWEGLLARGRAFVVSRVQQKANADGFSATATGYHAGMPSRFPTCGTGLPGGTGDSRSAPLLREETSV